MQLGLHGPQQKVLPSGRHTAITTPARVAEPYAKQIAPPCWHLGAPTGFSLRHPSLCLPQGSPSGCTLPANAQLQNKPKGANRARSAPHRIPSQQKKISLAQKSPGATVSLAHRYDCGTSHLPEDLAPSSTLRCTGAQQLRTWPARGPPSLSHTTHRYAASAVGFPLARFSGSDSPS